MRERTGMDTNYVSVLLFFSSVSLPMVLLGQIKVFEDPIVFGPIVFGLILLPVFDYLFNYMDTIQEETK